MYDFGKVLGLDKIVKLTNPNLSVTATWPELYTNKLCLDSWSTPH